MPTQYIYIYESKQEIDNILHAYISHKLGSE